MVAATLSREEAMAALDDVGADRLMLSDSGRYLGVVHRDQIVALPAGSLVTPTFAATGSAPHLAIDQLEQLDEISAADLETLALLVGGGVGLVVVRDGRPAGFLGWEALADALPALTDSAERGGTLDGTPESPARCYICRRCDPPLRRLPRSGREPPLCPADLLHGRMEREVV